MDCPAGPRQEREESAPKPLPHHFSQKQAAPAGVFLSPHPRLGQRGYRLPTLPVMFCNMFNPAAHPTSSSSSAEDPRAQEGAVGGSAAWAGAKEKFTVGQKKSRLRIPTCLSQALTGNKQHVFCLAPGMGSISMGRLLQES